MGTTLRTSELARHSMTGDRAPTPRLYTPMPKSALADSRILLAEDNATVRQVVRTWLERTGAEVLTARNGQDAVDWALAAEAAGRPFDAILMDMQMPILDGYEATRRLRDEGLDAIIIALTAYSAEHDREECFRIGCDEFLAKPFEGKKLLELVSSCVQNRRDGTPGAKPG
jgi:CheY-like chemotaxis protein